MKFPKFKIVMLLFLVLGFTSAWKITATLNPELHQKYLQPKDYKEVDYRSPIPIIDTLAALQLGELLFHNPQATLQGSCASCHKVEKAGFGLTQFPIGNRGDFDVILSHYQDGVNIDVQDVKTPATANCYETDIALWSGALGAKGINKDVSKMKLASFKEQNALGLDGIYTQVFVGGDVHNITPMIENCKDVPFWDEKANKAFGNKLSIYNGSIAIGMYEKSQVTSQSNFQRWLRGESEKLHSEQGFKIFLEKCESCHTGSQFGGNVIAEKIGKSDFQGRFILTGDINDLDMVKAPQLYNMKDSPTYFHSSEPITLFRAIKRHGLTTTSETWKVRSFLVNDCHDDSMQRYKEYCKMN